ncbi:MAG: hypothetical protein ACYTG0_16940 [Planctomycetota bacterium]|jgi:hypothetical protein
MKRHTIVLLVLLSMLGCSRQNNQAPRDQAASTTGSSVAVLGDDTRTSFRDGLVQAGCNAKSSDRANAADRVALIAAADACVVVVDSTWGPKPIHREDILLARQFSRGPVFIAFSKTSLVDDAELLELEELEMRELMNAYDLPGDTAEVFFDSPGAETRLPRGYSAAVGVLRKVPRLQSPSTHVAVEGASPAAIYCLAADEAFSRDLATTLETGTFDLVFIAGPSEASVQVSSPLAPGARGEAMVTVERGTDTGPDGRFVVVRNHHVIAAGTLQSKTR